MFQEHVPIMIYWNGLLYIILLFADTLILDNDITFSYSDSELDTDAGVNLTDMLLDDSIFDTTLS